MQLFKTYSEAFESPKECTLETKFTVLSTCSNRIIDGFSFILKINDIIKGAIIWPLLNLCLTCFNVIFLNDIKHTFVNSVGIMSITKS